MMLQTFEGIRRSALRRPPKAGAYQSRPDTASEALKKLDVFFQFFCNGNAISDNASLLRANAHACAASKNHAFCWRATKRCLLKAPQATLSQIKSAAPVGR